MWRQTLINGIIAALLYAIILAQAIVCLAPILIHIDSFALIRMPKNVSFIFQQERVFVIVTEGDKINRSSAYKNILIHIKCNLQLALCQEILSMTSSTLIENK
jgi:hypothetical protein